MDDFLSLASMCVRSYQKELGMTEGLSLRALAGSPGGL